MPSADLYCIEEGCRRKQESDRAYEGHLCSYCGGLLEVRCCFDRSGPEDLRRLWRQRRQSDDELDRSGVWRFRELLPLLKPGTKVVSLGEGSTPLLRVPRTGRWIGSVRLRVKHEGINPTGSFKDRGMTTCITRARLLGAQAVASASTGNTAASMAAYAAQAGMRALILIPQNQVSVAKLAQALDLGVVAVEVGNSFDESFRLLRLLAPRMKLYVANSIDPFRIEGQKTIVTELLEQCDWQPPDYIALPGGNLGNTSAIGKALQELKPLGLLDKVPRLIVVQAAGANPFFHMLDDGASTLTPIVRPQTEATAIRIGAPASWPKARATLNWTNGICESVTDQEILEAKLRLAEDGVGCEPASAAPVAAIRKLHRLGKLEPGADVVAILTGHQLKDTDYILRHRVEPSGAGQRLRIEPNLTALREALQPFVHGGAAS